jgi:hypothetical protein
MDVVARMRSQQASPDVLPLIDEDGIMDLNQLYFDHQIAVMRAGSALSCELRRDRQSDASLIAGRIGCMQRALGAGAARAWETLAARDVTDLSSRSMALHAPSRRDDLAPPQR